MKKMNLIKKAVVTLGLAAGIMAMPVSVYANADESASENKAAEESHSSHSSGSDEDNTPPTINAAINNGKLKVRAVDESGIKVIYVNNYEFFDPEDGVLQIRLEKFEAGIEYFTISAMDNYGNRSQDFSIKNPYWTDPDADSNNQKDPSEELPADASATDPGDATGEVTEHVTVDDNGYIIEESETYYTGENDPSNGREFYTIQTETGKVFYLIVERNDGDEIVHFVTDITENDLLNATSNNSEILPKNSLASDSSVPVSEVAIPADDGKTITVDSQGNKTVTDADGKVVEPEEEEQPVETVSDNGNQKPKKKMNPIFIYVGIGLIVIVAGYYLKVVKPKKQKGFVEDEEAEEQKEQEIEDEVIEDKPLETYSREQSNEDFFDSIDVNNDGGDV